MTFTAFKDLKLSDLVVHENDPSVGVSRRGIIVQSASGTETVKFGQLVFRAKATTTSSDTLAVYEQVTKAADLDVANEFAIVFGDNYGMKDKFEVTDSEADINAVAIVGGGVVVKEAAILYGITTPSAANKRAAKQLLEDQGIIVEQTI